MDSPGKKSTGVGCHCLLQGSTLGMTLHCSPPGSSVHGFSRQEYWSGLPLPSPHMHPMSSNARSGWEVSPSDVCKAPESCATAPSKSEIPRTRGANGVSPVEKPLALLGHSSWGLRWGIPPESLRCSGTHCLGVQVSRCPVGRTLTHGIRKQSLLSEGGGWFWGPLAQLLGKC